MIYRCKDYKNVTREKIFLWSRFFVCFWVFGSYSWNIRIFSSLGLESFISRNIRNFLRVLSFTFRTRTVIFWNIRESSVSRNRRTIFGAEWRNSWTKFRKRFWELRSESAVGSYFCKPFHHRCLTVFWICLVFWMYQGSKYTFPEIQEKNF